VGWLGYVGFVIGSVAIVLVAIVKETKAVKPSFRGIFLATCAGILNGLYLVIIDQLPSDAGLYPLVFNRMVNISIMFSVLVIALVILKIRNGRTLSQAGPARFDILVGDRGAHNYRAGIKLALICGVLDSTGNALLLYGVQIGELSTISILTALYPAGTIILAAIILKERITKLQFTGMVLAIVAAALLAVS
jgi:drug/metabolite transporter (DMT)-like permease